MAAPRRSVHAVIDRILQSGDLAALKRRLEPRSVEDLALPPTPPGSYHTSRRALARRRDFMRERGHDLSALFGEPENFDPESLSGNIESFIGFAQIPIGIAGPLRVNGSEASDDYYLPLATTEGALVASYNRGCLAASISGGVTSVCLTESVSRAPCFVFRRLIDAGEFVAWVAAHADKFQSIVERGSRHAKLLDIRTTLIGREVYLNCEYTSGDASGQNMVTAATAAIVQWILEVTPHKPLEWYIEGNLSGDKKATMLSFGGVRGKKVVAECCIAPEVLKRSLRTSAAAMQRCWEISFMGGAQSGAIGSQGHFANALAALFIACGQDVACVAEASVGLTRMQALPSGELYVAVTLPNLIVGTVGGGTRFPTAQACLSMLGCKGAGKARAFAEICAATVLAGEISIIAALTAGDFAKAHAKLGRSRTP